ncbi:MAG: amidase [Chloroflexi bacterium]|nr:amidase [Chloroflexota bacterium]
MTQTELCTMTAVEMAAAIRAKRLSPVEVIDAMYARIAQVNPRLNAYCTLTEEAARQAARQAEAAVMRGDALGALHGVPVSIKDLLITQGVRTMRGSKIYEQFVPTEDAPSVVKLKAAGAIVLGKTTTPEFGWKGTTDSLVTGISRNPWNLNRTCGGSSGGAGAAVAAGLGPLAVGTDGGGSIRIPASFNGIFGLKPSFGRVAAYPPSAVAMLSHTGPMTRTVRDAALMLGAMAGPDERDLGSLPADHSDYLAACEGGVKGLRVAWSANLGYAPVDPEVARITDDAARVFADLGCHLEAADPGFPNPEAFFDVLWISGLGTYLRDYLPQWQSQMDAGLVNLVKQVDQFTATDLAGALMQRANHWDVTRRFFERYDLLLTPTLAVAAFEAGAVAPSEIAGHKISWAGWTPFTFPFNLTGQPAATVPCGFTAEGLPVGLQIVGRRFADALVLRASAAFEEARPWAAKRPAL